MIMKDVDKTPFGQPTLVERKIKKNSFVECAKIGRAWPYFTRRSGKLSPTLYEPAEGWISSSYTRK